MYGMIPQCRYAYPSPGCCHFLKDIEFEQPFECIACGKWMIWLYRYTPKQPGYADERLVAYLLVVEWP